MDSINGNITPETTSLVTRSIGGVGGGGGLIRILILFTQLLFVAVKHYNGD